MSIQGAVQGIIPGAGQSFPVAGVRAKVRKHLFATASTTWVCPPNVYDVILAMCGGGGGGQGSVLQDDGFGGTTVQVNAHSGGSGAAIAPQVVRVVPGAVYTLTVGAGGAGGSGAGGAASNGGASVLSGPLLYARCMGGNGSNGGGVGGGAPAFVGQGGQQNTAYPGPLVIVGGSNGISGAATTGGNVQMGNAGATLTYLGYSAPGGAGSLFSVGGAGANSPVTPGFGAGGGVVIGTAWGTFNGSPGGPGFVYLSWEE